MFRVGLYSEFRVSPWPLATVFCAKEMKNSEQNYPLLLYSTRRCLKIDNLFLLLKEKNSFYISHKS
jgi:hypothetical protein